MAIGIAALGFLINLIATATAQWGVAPTGVVMFVGLLYLGALACAGISAWKLFGVLEVLLRKE